MMNKSMIWRSALAAAVATGLVSNAAAEEFYRNVQPAQAQPQVVQQAPAAQPVVAPQQAAAPTTPTVTKEVIKATEQGGTTEVSIVKVEQPKKRRVTTLPGVKPGLNSRLTRGSVIRTSGDGTETAIISNRFPNRISTPFDKPRVIGKTHAEVVKDGTSLFVAPPKSDDPFTIFITGSNANDPVISLTMIPKDIPSQVLTLQIDSSQGAARKAPRVEGYTQQLVQLLRTVATGKSPEGFSEGIMPNIVAKEEQNGLIILPVVRYSGSNLDIYKYKVENNHSDIELSETSFYQDGVRAVAIFPNVLLRKGDWTHVYVVADKSVLDGEENGR